jgi:hypothetical protein
MNLLIKRFKFINIDYRIVINSSFNIPILINLIKIFLINLFHFQIKYLFIN